MRRALWFVLAVVMTIGPSSSSSRGGEAGRDADGAGDGGTRAGGAPGGVLRVGVTALGSLDPAQARSPEQALVADQLFDSLTAFDPATLAPVPSLAARWETTPDQRQWTFFLRRGAAFANGRPITAGDVKYSLERVARRGSGSPGAELLQGVAGFLEYRNGAPELAGVTTPAVDVVRITLSDPLAELAAVVASPVLGVVPKEAVEAKPPARPFPDAPVGSGPYRIEARDGAVVSMVRSQRDGAPGGAGLARPVEVVRVIQYQAVSDAYRAFTRGELDWARVPPEELSAAASRYGDGAFRPYIAQLFYGFNLKNPKLADVRFREAIVRGIDRRAVVAAVYQGTVRLGEGIVAAGIPGHQRDPCPRCAHDPERSRALVSEAFPGSAAVPEVGLDFDADPGQEALARAIQASLAAVGIKVVLRPRAVDAYDEFMLSGEQDVFRLGWVAAYPSAEAFLSPLFRSGSANNLVGFASPEVDGLLLAARAEPDPARRTALYQDTERAILDQVPVIPIAQFEVHSVVSERVRNLVVTSFGTFDASAVALTGRP